MVFSFGVYRGAALCANRRRAVEAMSVSCPRIALSGTDQARERRSPQMFHRCSRRRECRIGADQSPFASSQNDGVPRRDASIVVKLVASPREATPMKEPGPANHAESGRFGAEHRVRTGDLRLGKANRPTHQRCLLLTNRPQTVEIIPGTKRLWTHHLANRPHRSTTVVFHRCSKTAPDPSRSRRSPCCSGGRRTSSAPPASAENSRTPGTI